MTASIIACFAFMLLGRRWYKMPVDLTALGVLPSLATLIVFAAHTWDGLIPSHGQALVVDAALFAVAGAFAVRHFDLFASPPPEDVVDGLTVP